MNLNVLLQKMSWVVIVLLLVGCSAQERTDSKEQKRSVLIESNSNKNVVYFYQNNKATDIKKLKKSTDLSGYISDEELAKKGGKFERKKIMTYQEYLDLGLEFSNRYDIDPNRQVWVFTAKFSKPQEFEGVLIDKANVTTVFDAETGDIITVNVRSEQPEGMDKLKLHL